MSEIKYPDSIFTPEDRQMEDVFSRIVQTDTWAGQIMYKIWTEELNLSMKMKLYKSAVCSILVYGAEAWKLNEKTCRMHNETNTTHITDKTRHEEASPKTKTFDVVSWIKSWRLRWLNEIPFITDEIQHMLKTVVKDMQCRVTCSNKGRLEGSGKMVQVKPHWNKLVKKLKISVTTTQRKTATNTRNIKLIQSPEKENVKTTKRWSVQENK